MVKLKNRSTEYHDNESRNNIIGVVFKDLQGYLSNSEEGNISETEKIKIQEKIQSKELADLFRILN